MARATLPLVPALPDDARARAAALRVETDADARLHADYVDACRTRPGITVSAEAFAEAVRARTAGDEPGAIVGGDLVLALACAAGDEAALAVFESEIMRDAARALAKLRIERSSAADLLQAVRTKVLVGKDAPPKIASYSARGPLAGWVRAIAVHEALSVRRAEVRRGREETPSILERMPAFDPPEMAGLRATYAVPFKAAFGDALTALSARDRNVLRLVYSEGLTAEQVGLAYGVHRVSVARWLGQIREVLFATTRRLLQERLRLSAAEFDSVTRLCLSQIDVSLDRLLGESDA